MSSKEEILRRVCEYSSVDELMSSDDITISEAIEAMEAYAKKKAWDIYMHVICLFADIQHTPYDEDFERRGFDLWWEENK